MIAEAKKTDVQMPWARGLRRDAFIAKKTGVRSMKLVASA
tara:strand:+ start:28383 stop:28502 length:120 start_codon:yes stop_codon:yes gene_type:complete